MWEYANYKPYIIKTFKKFIFIPKRCFISNKLLWLTYVYVQTCRYTGPGDVIYEDIYFDKNEFIFAKLAGKI